MKAPLIATAIHIFAVAVSLAGALPDFDATNAEVHSVDIRPDAIALVVSGDCTFPVMTERLPGGGWRGGEIRTLMDHTTIIIPRENRFREMGWDEYCKLAQSLAGHRAWFQIASESEVFERGQLKVVKCVDASFQLKKQ